jgi:RNA polymerase sigma factor (sigma-70 family)
MDRKPPEGDPLDVVRQAQAGDREAFEMLVERHAAETHRIAAAIVGPVDARDVTQETFVAAWQQLPRLRAADAFAPWLRRICVNRARNWLRSMNRRGRPTSLDADGDFAARLPDPGRDFRGAVEARMVLEPAFEQLSSEQRAVLALHYSMGLSIAEAAAALGIRVGTAKSRLNAGLNALRGSVIGNASDAQTEATP